MNGELRIVGLGGSLAEVSRSRAALTVALRGAEHAGARTELLDLRELDLPMFDPDDESHPSPPAERLLEACYGADGMLWASPMYQGTISGAFKNALDWTVGSTALNRKPVALLDVAVPGRGERGRQALDWVLTALDADVAHYAVPVTASDLDAEGEIDDGTIVDQLRSVVVELAERVRLDDAA